MEMVWKERIRRRLLRIPPRRNPAASNAQAAVLMGLLDCGGEPTFLLTKRTWEVATHKGQICFPGGVEEAGDRSLWQTALRETGEEVGIEPEYVELLGRFHDYQAVTDTHVRLLRRLPETGVFLDSQSRGSGTSPASALRLLSRHPSPGGDPASRRPSDSGLFF